MRRATRPRQLRAIEQRIRIGPLRTPRRRIPSAPAATRADDAAAAERASSVTFTSEASNARSTATSQSCGVRNLRASAVHASGRSTSASATARRSPSVSRNTARDAIDGGGRRLVADEVRDELRRHEARRRRVAAERADGALGLVLARLPVADAEQRLRAGLVQERLEHERDVVGRARHHRRASPAATERASARRLPLRRESADGPAGQHLRELLDVLLRVAAVDAERVQLEQLARVVLVQSARGAAAAAARARGRASSDRSTGSCRDRRASPDASPTPAPCPRSGRARAGGWPRARSCRQAAPRGPWRRSRRTGGWTRTRRAARRTAARS